MRRNPLPPAPRDADGFQIMRPTCLKCIRPSAHCVCELLKKFTAHFNLLILQHPNERKKYYSTAKLVLGSINNCKLLGGVEFEEQKLKKLFDKNQHYLLYPGSDSQDCEQIKLSREDTVVVLDGTWSEAGKILFRNPILKTLPKISFNRSLRSEYKIRKQPKEKYLSTLESIAHLITLNASSQDKDEYEKNQDNYQQLFGVFSAMVEKQLNYFPRMQANQK